MASTADFRNGLCFEYNGVPHQIIEFLHVKPGKGPAFVRTKLRNLETGRVIDNTFNSGVKVKDIRIENRTYQYLYNDGEGYHFMNTSNYEQISLMKELINAPQFLKDGMNVNIMFHADEERAMSCELPQTVTLKITYTEPGIKGNTATNATKPATVETGAEVKVPLFIEEGENIVINTADGSYKERAK
ncbi:MAG: elongation factor P [Schleiferiaceae bacterium]|jgi:elongation factor P|nr:elongation factor P [Schleiferiaceae bacterium]